MERINDVYNNKCSFEPGRYHGVKLEYFWNSNKEKLDGICNCSKHCFGKGSGKDHRLPIERKAEA